jgi:peptidoglycan/LPS O-acetylase OafA/YrhL
MEFRKDIQILRGISVLFVVLFHLGFVYFQSGFLGVDVFFVISGFLMAILYTSGDKKSFFIRRAKRLLPAYYVTILVTLVVSFIVNTPNEANQVASQAIWGSTFTSNIGFWNQNSYFSKLEYNPLLHLWSLGVEIQFYLIVPLIAWFFNKSKFFLLLFFALSIMLCFTILTISPKTSFFMMPLRVWEFLLGYGAASIFTNRGKIINTSYSWYGLIGLILIFLIPLFPVDGESLNPINGHPGLISLAITSATVMVLVFGLPSWLEKSYPCRLLSTLGNYSYSIYLVHFPVIVIYLSQPFGGTILKTTEIETLIQIILLIVLLSYVLNKFVETKKFSSNILKISLFTSAAIAAIAFSLPFIKNMIMLPEEQKIFLAFQDRSEYRCGKLIRVTNPKAISCMLTPDAVGNKGNVLLLGNSHADAIKDVFSQVALEKQKSVYFIIANNPLMSGGPTPSMIIDDARTKKIDHIFVHFSPGTLTINQLTELITQSEREKIKVTLIKPVPTWEKHIPSAMYQELVNGAPRLTQSKEDYMKKNEEFFEAVNALRHSNFNQVSIVDYYCEPECRYKNETGTPLYFDDSHLTLTGSLVIEKALYEAIN